MPSPYHRQLQSDAACSSSTATIYRPSTRTSTSSDSSSSSSASGSYFSESSMRYFTPASRPRVEVMRCSRCTKCVETIVSVRSGSSSEDDAQASGMVRFGHNLYYCDRCARMVGYK
ncbi:hypothetical protein QTJ16_001182 [Diplocarpon rosae]|uniref:Uncharacterized protein n=1 Tax=Diplocarpon rosae TaxID=946125 RepID=A0AAD9WG06_9HELO|nr:hypothetical protein QTJ16_001182 [Diplocarpon rosae]